MNEPIKRVKLLGRLKDNRMFQTAWTRWSERQRVRLKWQAAGNQVNNLLYLFSYIHIIFAWFSNALVLWPAAKKVFLYVVIWYSFLNRRNQESIIKVTQSFVKLVTFLPLGGMIQQKLVDEISLNFPKLFIIGKYVKNEV